MPLTCNIGSRDLSSNDAATRYCDEGLKFAGEAVQTNQTRLTWPASPLVSPLLTNRGSQDVIGDPLPSG